MKIKPRFESLPRTIRQCAVAIFGWRNRINRFGEEYDKWEKFLAESNHWSARRRQDWQRQQLLSLLDAARRGTAYYAKQLPKPEELKPADLQGLLLQIPILEKNSLRHSPGDFRNNQIKETSETSTSGSTGSPMTVGHDKLSIQRRFAFLNDHLRLAGIKMIDPSVRLSGRILCTVGKRHKMPWLYNPAENQLLLSSYHLDDSHASSISDRLHKMKPVLLDGYPSAILQLLRILDGNGRPLTSVKAIVTTAETLHPHIRDELISLSAAPVMDYYAASEGVPLIQQCPKGVYHVRWQSGLFEVDDGDKISLGGDGELICTSFVQDRTPLIRYRTGDLVRGLRQSTSDACECGLTTPTVDQVQGRVEDMIHTPDGRALGMFTYRTLKYIEGLGETQVIQRDYTDFEVNSTADAGTDPLKLQEEIKESFERALGYSVTLRFNRVDKIPHGPNGKVRLVISKVPKK